MFTKSVARIQFKEYDTLVPFFSLFIESRVARFQMLRNTLSPFFFLTIKWKSVARIRFKE